MSFTTVVLRINFRVQGESNSLDILQLLSSSVLNAGLSGGIIAAIAIFVILLISVSVIMLLCALKRRGEYKIILHVKIVALVTPRI